MSTILIIDDDEVVLATTQALLQAAGHEVSTHTGAFGATQAIMKARPDLVLLDLNMPGLSGTALANLVHERSGSERIRIFFFSSSEEAVLQASVEETGADGYIRKGDRAELEQQVARALAS